MNRLSRSERVKRYCEGRKKQFVAEQRLGIPRQMMTYLLRVDIDELIERIDALDVDDDEVRIARRRTA